MAPNRYFPEIDCIRFFAAALVVSFHYSLMPKTGWVGVEIFFVISGLVIAGSASGSTAGQFMFSRMLRLYPASWLCATITLFVLAQSQHAGDLLPSYLRSMALLPKAPPPWIDYVYWTLAIEISFYAVVFALLLAGVSSHSKLAIALAIWSLVFNVLDAAGRLPELMTSQTTNVNLLLLRHGCFFALGIFFYVATQRRLNAIETIAAAMAAAACALEVWTRSHEYDAGGSYVALAIWLVSVGLICLFTHKQVIARTSIPRTLGLMTFPLYLVHNLTGLAIIKHLDAAGWNRSLSATFTILLVLGISLVVCLFGEPPIRKTMRSIAARDRPPTVAQR